MAYDRKTMPMKAYHGQWKSNMAKKKLIWPIDVSPTWPMKVQYGRCESNMADESPIWPMWIQHDRWKSNVANNTWPMKTYVRHCGLAVSAPIWDGTGCEFDSWQCRIYIYIPFSLSLWLLGSLRGSLGAYGLTQKLCWKNKLHMEAICLCSYDTTTFFLNVKTGNTLAVEKLKEVLIYSFIYCSHPGLCSLGIVACFRINRHCPPTSVLQLHWPSSTETRHRVSGCEQTASWRRSGAMHQILSQLRLLQVWKRGRNSGFKIHCNLIYWL